MIDTISREDRIHLFSVSDDVKEGTFMFFQQGKFAVDVSLLDGETYLIDVFERRTSAALANWSYVQELDAGNYELIKTFMITGPTAMSEMWGQLTALDVEYNDLRTT